MKQKFTFLLLMVIGFVLNSQVVEIPNKTKNGEVTIGSESLLDYGYPVYSFFEYSYSQSIYYQSEIGAANVISKIWYHFGGNTLSKSNNWTIYMGHTTKNSIESSSDWIDYSQLIQVYSGTFADPGEEGWIEFDITDFNYNGVDNLVIAVDENAEGNETSSNNFYCSSVATKRGILDYSDSQNIDPQSPPTNALFHSYIPNVRLYMGIAPNIDASITEVVSPSGYLWDFESGSKTVVVNIKNEGISNLESATINWSVNGVSQAAVNWSGNLAEDESENVSLGTFDFSNAKIYKIEAEIVTSGDENSSNNSIISKYDVVAPYIPDYTENFDTTLWSELPSYWKTEINVEVWQVDDDYGYSGDNSLTTYYNPDSPKDDWAFSPMLDLKAWNLYEISFWVDAPGWDDVPESMELYVASGQSSEEVIKKLWSNSSLITTDWEKVTIDFIPSASKAYSFGLYANSIADLDYISVDDFTVLDKGLTQENSIDAVEVIIAPNPSSGIVTVDSPGYNELSILDVSGKVIKNECFNENIQINLSEAGVYIFVVSSKTGVAYKKVIIK